ncbi:hypothetical protein [Leptolyngbya sp. FACHB-261]|uniref:hypothetical protein n=1 Tax=Leptolyngbya sp. FACHB-261 TaxID=2692806 RepID=UPI00168A18E5|nr:hypothetical protein [Leptolyngbya sp. FACHB-261]MBD2102538.1 hypothetical protein [Leptolyngbya sp. FACHB-261]
MSLRTRGSDSLDKAQRRLALLKAINENLDLGHGLNIATYSRLIETTRTTIEAHNTLLSNLEESRKTVTEMDKALSELSQRMLSGIATIYGRNSMEYAKAGGSNRKRSKQPTSTATTSTPQPTPTATTNASTNGSSKTLVVS